MTTEQILVWVTIGAIGMIAFMVFMYGMARAKCHSLENDNVYLKSEVAVKSNKIRYLEHDLDISSDEKELLKIELTELQADLSTEGDLRRDASQQIEAMHNELNQLNRLVQKRGKDGRYISK